MSQFWIYFQLGLQHILDWRAYDHILFLIVLVAGYSFTNWAKVLWLFTAFILGYTLVLFLSVYEIMIVDSAWVELLIPLTILVTAIYNIMTAKKKERHRKMNMLYFITAFFGIIHGLGFFSYFKMVPYGTETIFVPLLGFVLGITGALLIVLLLVLLLAFILQNVMQVSRRDWILIVSSIVIGIILPVLQENYLAL